MNVEGNYGPALLSKQPVVQSTETDQKRTGASVTGEGGAASEGARVVLSDRAKGLLSLREAVDQAPDVRESRVLELKAAIESGTYNISGKLVAQSMVRSAALEAFA